MPRKHRNGSLHLCNWPNCRRPVPYDMWGCRPHWFTLPDEIRESLLTAWRFGRGRASPEWQEAQARAVEWINGIADRIKALNVTSPPVPTPKESADVDSDSQKG